jgi:sugar lactone lactonase YvrE
LAVVAVLVVLAAGCAGASARDGRLEQTWGGKGTRDGRLQKPRGAAIDAAGQLHVSDMTDRIQVFSPAGEFLRLWRLPQFDVDGPTGLSFDHEGHLLVADTHFFRVLVFDREGQVVQTVGAGVQGTAPGQFGYVRDVVRDRRGQFFTCESGECDRIQVFAADGKFLRTWGAPGPEPGRLRRPEALALDARDRLFVADSCNHRIQIFDPNGRLLAYWGTFGTAPGQLAYPYDIGFGPDGNLYVVEWGNCRVQKFTPDGRSLGIWGSAGREPGQLNNPWALAIDGQGRVHVIDTGNHRVQRVAL